MLGVLASDVVCAFVCDRKSELESGGKRELKYNLTDRWKKDPTIIPWR